MLRKPVSMEQRANELRLLKEYEAAGKIRRIDYVQPEELELTVEEEEELEQKLRSREWHVDRESLGDGNFRLGHEPKE